MSKNNGGQAFPTAGSHDYPPNNGMSLRDWYKGKTVNYFLSKGESLEEASRLSGVLADLMVKEGEKYRNRYGEDGEAY